MRHSRKRKRHSGGLQTHPDPSTSTVHSNTFESSMEMFRAVANSMSSSGSAAVKASKNRKSTASTTNPRHAPSPKLRVPSIPQRNTGGASGRGTTWKLDTDTGTFVAVTQTAQPMKGPIPRANISRPRYHRSTLPSKFSDVPQSRPSLFSGDIKEGSSEADGNNVSRFPSPEAIEVPFTIQCPTYINDLDRITVETKLSRHARRRAAAALRWDRDVIPSLIRPYMEYMRKSRQGELPPGPASNVCSCNGHGVLKQVTAVYMDREYNACYILLVRN